MPAKKPTTAAKKRATAKKTVKRASKKTTPVVEETPVVESVTSVTEETVTENVEVTTTPVLTVEEEVDTLLAPMLENLTQMNTLWKSTNAALKNVRKHLVREGKQTRKADAKRTRKGGAKKEPSGFAKPSPLSESLCTFLNLPDGTKLARTEVTRYLNQYIKKNELRDPSDKRIIKPNEALKSLLGVNDEETLTYFNLQKFISRQNLVLPNKSTVV